MNDAPPLPELQSQDLDDATLDALFGDLRELAEIVTVRLKHAAVAHADARTTTLDEAHAALRDGRCLGAQVHYRFQGQAFVDTLLRHGTATRLTRMRL